VRVRGARSDKSQTDVRTRWSELLDLEELLAQLSVTALKLPPGVERRDSLAKIARFRERITAMKRAEVDRASTIQSVA
jgi:hypothetical protein